MHKPKRKSRTPHLHAQPLLMIQIFSTPPYIIAKGDEKRLDDPKRVEDFLTEIQTMARELIASTSPTDEVRVSGVPYAVEADKLQAKRLDQAQIPSPEDHSHG